MDNSPETDPFIGERTNPQEEKIFAEKKVSLWPFNSKSGASPHDGKLYCSSCSLPFSDSQYSSSYDVGPTVDYSRS